MIDPVRTDRRRRRDPGRRPGREASGRRGAERLHHHRPLRADARRVRRDRSRCTPGAVASSSSPMRCGRRPHARRSTACCRASTATTPATRSASSRRRSRSRSPTPRCRAELEAHLADAWLTGSGRQTIAAEPAGDVESPGRTRRRRTRRDHVAGWSTRHACGRDALVATWARHRRRASRRRSSAPATRPRRRRASGRRRIGSVCVNGVHAERDVVAAVEVGAVGAVHLAPAAVAVGAEPQVGLVEVAEQQELAHLPRAATAGSRSRRVRARRGRSPSTPSFSQRSVERPRRGRRPTSPTAPRGRRRGARGNADSTSRHDSSLPRPRRSTGTVPSVTPLEDAQSFVIASVPTAGADRRGVRRRPRGWCSPPRWSPPRTCRRSTTPRSTGTRCAPPTSAERCPVELAVVDEVAAGAAHRPRAAAGRGDPDHDRRADAGRRRRES